MLNYFIFTPITELLILITIFGQGLFVNNFLKLNEYSKSLNFSEICLYGFCSVLILTQIINLFLPISSYIFWFFFIISSTYLYFQKLNFKNIINWIIKILILLLILLPMKLVIKGNEDLYYHLPKVNLINDYKIILGIGNYYESFAFTNGWSHISAFFNFFNGAEKNLYLVSFIFFILALDVIYRYFKNTTNFSLKVFCTSSILFLVLKFYRIQEFGNDYQAIILIFIVFICYYKYLIEENKDNQNNQIKKIIFFSVFISLFKIHGILILLLLCIFIIKKENIFKIIFFRLYFILIFAATLTICTSFLNSGCLLFPFEKTCISKKNISWSMKDDIEKINLSLEAFNKSYPIYKQQYKDKAMSKKDWIKNFNWLHFHFSNEQIYTGIYKTIFILLSIFLLFYKYSRIKLKKITEINLYFFIISIIILIIWSIKIPLMRASGYGYLACNLIFLFCSLIDRGNYEKLEKIFKKMIIFLIFFVLILNTIRISKEIKKYNTNDFSFFTYHYKEKSGNNLYDSFKKSKKVFYQNIFTDYYIIKK